MQFELGTLLRIPRGTPETGSLELELGKINAIEARKAEIAYVNKETAPELMQVFNTAYCDTYEMMSKISYEYTQALKYANKRRGIVLLDIAPEEIKNRGLKTSEDLRNAVLDQDEEYLTLMDKANLLKAAHEFLRGKAKGFEMAYHTVKSSQNPFNSNFGSNHAALSSGISDEVSPDTVVGRPRY